MKKLTYSSMAAARLRANKRQYMSLVLGIFLSIFLISTLVLSVWGIYQAELQKRYDRVGYLDMVMLRAVGADEKAILGCYSGQINASVIGGMGISLGLYLAFLVFYLISALNSGYYPASDISLLLLMGVTICIMGVLCLGICKFLLRFRIREIVNKSIIDNIREL